MDAREIEQIIDESARVIGSVKAQAGTVEAICAAVVGALRAGHKVLTAGHGGSAADALHMAEELIGRFRGNRRPLPAVCLCADVTAVTCIANDFGFTELFPRQVEALGQPGDVLVFFTSSGRGEGFRKSAQFARQRSMITIGFLGKDGGDLRGQLTHELIVPSDATERIQEAHTLLLHLVLEAVEREYAGDVK